MSLLRDLVALRDPLYRQQVSLSQQRRFKPDRVDEIYRLDRQGLTALQQSENISYGINLCSKAIARLKKSQLEPTNKGPALSLEEAVENRLSPESLEGQTVNQLQELSKELGGRRKAVQEERRRLEEALKGCLSELGNVLRPGCPVSRDEEGNATLRSWGEPLASKFSTGHYQVMKRLGLDMSDRVVRNFGHRSYFLTGQLLRLKQALVQYACDFLTEAGYLSVEVPVLINGEGMADIAQLSDFDSELYRVQDGEQTRYLIATSEQSMVAYHRDRTLYPKQLPLRYSSISSCFRREAGNSGRDMTGIFRVHQFEKVEQFCVSSPDESDRTMEEMIGNAERFYQSLGIPYRVVNIASGALNNAAALKYDLEGWFPVANSYRELVSCSNCTDFQARKINCRVMGPEQQFSYPHMLNSTLCAVTRTLCVICETYQTESGVVVPAPLRPYLGGMAELPFQSKEG
jgi:seryl-tRNA synthetase